MMKRPQVTKVFRLKYILPRVVILALVAAAVRFGLDPLLKWGLVAGGEAALGAKVEIGELTTSLTGGELRITGLAAANPSKPMRNVLEADSVELVLDAGQLLHKRVVIKSGTITGIEFDSERETSGALPEAPPVAEEAGPTIFDPVLAAGGDAAASWFDGLSGRVEEDLAKNLQTPKLVDDLKTRWPQKYAELQAKTDELRAKSKAIETEIREIKKNPLRGVEKLGTFKQELATIEGQMKSALAEINALPEQAKADRIAIDAARKADEAFLKTQLKLAKTDGDQLTQYLLGDEANAYLADAASWIGFARKVVPANNAKIKRADRSRGVDVTFGPRQPQMLLERVALAGHARLSGQDLLVWGELTDVTTEPQLHPNPAKLTLSGTGALECHLLVELDRRGETPNDHMVFDCPKVVLAGRTLGKPDRLAVSVQPGEASIHAELRMEGDQLAGVVHLRQSSGLTAAAPQLRDERLSAAVAQSLSGVNAIEANVVISGTLKKPRCKIDSDLGKQLAAGLDGAVRGYVTDKKDKLLAKISGQADAQLAELNSKCEATKQELLAKLGENQQLVTQLTSLAGGGGLPGLDTSAIPQLGGRLSLDKLKR